MLSNVLLFFAMVQRYTFHCKYVSYGGVIWVGGVSVHPLTIATEPEILEYKGWLSADRISMLEQIRSSELPMVITALYLPDFKDVLDNPTSRETLARCIYKLYVLAKKVNE